MTHTNIHLGRTLASALLAAGFMVAFTPVQASNAFLKAWQDAYPNSTTDSAGCDTCHGTSTGNLNAYGKDLCVAFGNFIPSDITPYLRALEGLNSDGDTVGPDYSSNLAEINANAQPGWTTTAPNMLTDNFDRRGAALNASVETPPSDVPWPSDTPVYGEPVAIPGGPYTGVVYQDITFDGSGSYDSDDINGGIVSYAWDFDDGSTSTEMMPKHAYSVPGIYTVSLTVRDEEGDVSTNSTSATIISASALDLDIAGFKVSKSVSVGKPVSIQLVVENNGSILGQALATVVGEQKGVEVYRRSQYVFDDTSRGTTTFSFLAYTPTAKDTIAWTVTIADGNADDDRATATTVVK